jgi:hypothetical protein
MKEFSSTDFEQWLWLKLCLAGYYKSGLRRSQSDSGNLPAAICQRQSDSGNLPAAIYQPQSDSG